MRKRGWVVVTDTDDEEAEDAEGAQAGTASRRSRLRSTTCTGSRATSVGQAKGGHANAWKKFTPTKPPTAERIAALTAACAAKGVLVVATANDEGHVEIASAEPGPGAAAGVVPWAIVKDVAPGIFGQCTSVAVPSRSRKRPSLYG